MLNRRDFEGPPPERDPIEADEERARNQRARELAGRTPDQALHDQVCATLKAPQPAVAAMNAPDPDPEGASPRLPVFHAAPPAYTIKPPAKAPRKPRQAPQAKPPQPTAAPPAAPGPTLSSLDQAVEDLVRRHGNCAVIDAAWAAAHRLFRPAA